MSDRHLKQVTLSKTTVSDMMRKGWRLDGKIECVEGLPVDAVLVGILQDDQIDCLQLLFQHSSFEEVPVGQPIPEIAIIHRQTLQQ